jgi:hypothetical protein
MSARVVCSSWGGPAAFCAVAALALAGCVTTPAEPWHPRRPLPDGSYQHDVSVVMDRVPPQKFNGVLKKGDGRLSLVLLSPFGTTLVRIGDTVDTTAPKVDVYADELKPQAGRIEDAYRDLKPVLLDLATDEVEVFGHDAAVAHAAEDAKGVPRTTTISGHGFTITVEVSGYELAAQAR